VRTRPLCSLSLRVRVRRTVSVHSRGFTTITCGISWDDASLQCRQTPLSLASKAGSTEVVGILLEAGADVNQKCDLGRTALHYAARCVLIIDVSLHSLTFIRPTVG